MCRARGIRLRLLAAAVAASLASTAGLPAQVIPPGTRLRVKLKVNPPAYLYGTLVRVQADTLILRPGDDPDFTLSTVPLAMIASTEVRQGTHGHAKTGALIGFGVGALTGAAALVAFNQGWGESAANDDVGAGIIGGFFGGVAGAGLGMLVGSAIRSESWSPVPLTSLRVGPVALNRVGVGVSVRF